MLDHDPGFIAGFIGVIVATLVAKLTEFIMMLHGYSKLLKELEEESSPDLENGKKKFFPNSNELKDLLEKARNAKGLTSSWNVKTFLSNVIDRYEIAKSMVKMISDMPLARLQKEATLTPVRQLTEKVERLLETQKQTTAPKSGAVVTDPAQPGVAPGASRKKKKKKKQWCKWQEEEFSTDILPR